MLISVSILLYFSSLLSFQLYILLLLFNSSLGTTKSILDLLSCHFFPNNVRNFTLFIPPFLHYYHSNVTVFILHIINKFVNNTHIIMYILLDWCKAVVV